MTDPVQFTSLTPRFSLPLLFTAQAQKEFYVNEAHVLTDALLHTAVLGSCSEPPSTASNGDCWLVTDIATGAFIGHEGELANFQEGQWLYIRPDQGMTVFDKGLGKRRYFDGNWKTAVEIDAPASGAVIDQEARTAITHLITALRTAGVLANS